MNDESNKPQRIQRKRSKGWTMPAGAVSVTRGGQWGNEFKPGETLRRFSPVDGTPEIIPIPDAATAVRLFRERIERALQDWPQRTRAQLEQLRGKTLACWCKLSEPCHADVLLELANATTELEQLQQSTTRGETTP